MVKKSRTMDRHHRIPRSRGGDNTPENISLVEQKLHRAWHLLFGNMMADEVASAISDCWIDSGYYLVAVPRKKKKPKAKRVRRYCTDCSAEVLKFIPQTTKEE